MIDKKAAIREFAETLNRRMLEFAQAGMSVPDQLAHLDAVKAELEAELSKVQQEIAELEAKTSSKH